MILFQTINRKQPVLATFLKAFPKSTVSRLPTCHTLQSSHHIYVTVSLNLSILPTCTPGEFALTLWRATRVDESVIHPFLVPIDGRPIETTRLFPYSFWVVIISLKFSPKHFAAVQWMCDCPFVLQLLLIRLLHVLKWSGNNWQWKACDVVSPTFHETFRGLPTKQTERRSLPSGSQPPCQ